MTFFDKSISHFCTERVESNNYFQSGFRLEGPQHLSGLPFGLFKNFLPDIKGFGELTFFMSFLMSQKMVPFKGRF